MAGTEITTSATKKETGKTVQSRKHFNFQLNSAQLCSALLSSVSRSIHLRPSNLAQVNHKENGHNGHQQVITEAGKEDRIAEGLHQLLNQSQRMQNSVSNGQTEVLSPGGDHPEQLKEHADDAEGDQDADENLVRDVHHLLLVLLLQPRVVLRIVVQLGGDLLVHLADDLRGEGGDDDVDDDGEDAEGHQRVALNLVAGRFHCSDDFDGRVYKLGTVLKEGVKLR